MKTQIQPLSHQVLQIRFLVTGPSRLPSFSSFSPIPPLGPLGPLGPLVPLFGALGVPP